MIDAIKDVADSKCDVAPGIDSVLAIFVNDEGGLQRLEHVLDAAAIGKRDSHEHVENRDVETRNCDGCPIEAAGPALDSSAFNDRSWSLLCNKWLRDRASRGKHWINGRRRALSGRHLPNQIE